ncbi:MAG TPA: DUF433 domain-containing protein [Planctomycetota bacterium]|nr:DUF433 domain-containing protein [Planctomycetota bacterium]
MDERVLQRISLNPRVMAGKPVIRGTRIPVELIVRMLGQGIPEPEILREYPRLEPEDIRAALAYAAEVLADEDVFALTPASSPNHSSATIGTATPQRQGPPG